MWKNNLTIQRFMVFPQRDRIVLYWFTIF